MINNSGHFTCYKKRTFSLANDIDGLPVIHPEPRNSIDGLAVVLFETKSLNFKSNE